MVMPLAVKMPGRSSALGPQSSQARGPADGPLLASFFSIFLVAQTAWLLGGPLLWPSVAGRALAAAEGDHPVDSFENRNLPVRRGPVQEHVGTRTDWGKACRACQTCVCIVGVWRATMLLGLRPSLSGACERRGLRCGQGSP